MEVSFLMDSGAGSSIMSVGCFMPSEKEFTSKIFGIGGYKGSAAPVMSTLFISSKTYVHPLKPVFIEGENSLVILGRDFMSRFGETHFDWDNQRIKLGDDWVYYLDQASEDSDKFKPLVNDQLSDSQARKMQDCISKNNDVFAHNPKAPKECSSSSHAIISRDNRVSMQRPRRINHKKLPIINEQVDEMLQFGIIRPSKSPYNSNIHLEPKKDGSQRFCFDFRNLNRNTVPDTYGRCPM